MKTGKFIISLDFELMWGVRDNMTIDNYGGSILGVRPALDHMLEVFEQHNIRATFAVVGFLFHENRISLYENIPTKRPSYLDTNLSPYTDLDSFLGQNETDDPYYFGYSLVQKIKNKKVHEIATHTYCHYYSLEKGQTIEQFEEDLNYAIKIADLHKVEIKSIVFPRNQFNDDYLSVCKQLGITSFRGNEKSQIYISSNGESQTLIRRALRFLDSYINITGHHCYKNEQMKESILVNIPSSRFLRPYSAKLVLFDRLKFLRIKNAMTYAAKNNLMYHLWWHPHNFGSNCFENIKFLSRILEHYVFLNNKYKFQSMTMDELSHELNSN
jgi:peptidoglycan/xylan/chitin deacetylase (PgdA/CDA1 family)